MGLGCGGKCGMVFLLVLNTLFLLLGLGLMITGILMISNFGIQGVWPDVIEKLLNNIKLNDNLSLDTVNRIVPVFVTGVGAGIFVLALLGYLGACCKNRFALIVYAILVLLILIAHIVCIALFVAMKDTIEKQAKSQLTTEFNKYTGPTGTDENTKSWNVFFIGFECCGVHDTTTTANGFMSTVWGTSVPEKIPYSCCTSATETNYLTGTDISCTQTLTAGKYHSKGCYKKTYDRILSYQEPVIAVSATLLLIELVAVIFSFIFCKSLGDKDEVV